MGYAASFMRSLPSRIGLVAVALAIAVTACTDSAPQSTATVSTSSTTAAPVTTTTAPVTTTTAPPTPGDAPSISVGEGVDQDAVAQLATEVTQLVAVTERVRGLPFLEQPSITILGPEEFATRLRTSLEEDLDAAAIGADTRLYRLLGILGPDDDLLTMYLDLYTEQVAGFYDGDTKELVIAGDAADLSAFDKSVVVHELVHALTDQHFAFSSDFRDMIDGERYDEAAALQALFEGDATYFQLLYIQELPLAEQLALTNEMLAAMDAQPVLSSMPRWMQEDLAFPYNVGQAFVQDLIDAGGIAEVDTAYVEPPVSTELVMHPDRYRSGEGIRPVTTVAIDLPGFTSHETSTFGEEGFRLLLLDSVPPGVLTQAVDGWGGDSYEVMFDQGDLVMALAYKGDTVDDAFELTDAIITHLTTTMDLGPGRSEGGGLVFTAADGRYAFINRIGDGFVLVVATDPVIGERARSQMRVP